MSEIMEIPCIDFVGEKIIKEIEFLEKAQDRAFSRNDLKTFADLADKIISAIEKYERHINSERDRAAAYSKVLYGKSEPVRPPSPKLLQTALEIYSLNGVDGLSGDSILERIRKAEISFWNRK